MPSSRSQYIQIPTRSSSEDSPTPSQPSTSLPSAARPPTRSGPSPVAAEVDALFRRWTSTIAERVRLKKSTSSKKRRRDLIDQRDREQVVEILASVFEVWESPAGKGKEKEVHEEVMTLDHEPPLSHEAFEELVDQVRVAIESGVQPRLNSKGSSGSYFARDVHGVTVGIYKPKDEEPYGRLNPKLTKWLHRNFFSRIIPFGRACLIPQLSYLSESAASLLDRRLGTHIVPRTEVASLSSRAFFYDWIDIERAGRKGRLPDKDGSFQVFLKGFTDASGFLRQHPYPGRPLSLALEAPERGRRRRKGGVSLFGPLRCLCGRAMAEDDEEDDFEEEDVTGSFRWTQELMESFREQLEQLVVLDYLIRNTDRGLDNFMVKPCLCSSPPPSASPTPRPSTFTSPPTAQPPMTELNARPLAPSPPSLPHTPSRPHIHVAAIDNSLAFPHAHPAGWRTFTYGWLDLPAALIGQPFTRATRDKFLPLLTSPTWWEQTTLELRSEFERDDEFKEKMFYKQMAVMKGQAFNLVQSLLDEDEGPIELCRRPKKLVWDDLTLVADDDMTRSLLAAAHAPPSSSTDSASSTLVEPIPESVPIAPPFTRERTASYGHARTNSATVSSVVSSHAFPGAVTGVEVVRTLDRREKEERRAVGRGASVEPEVLEESEDEDEGWGVQSEGDLLGGRSAPMPSFASRAAEGSHSFESQRPSRPLLHARSGSFSSSPSDQPPSRRPVLMRKAYSSRRALGHRAAGSEDAGRRSASWVRAFGGAGRVDEEVEEVEEERQRVVVVERLEELKDEPRFGAGVLCF